MDDQAKAKAAAQEEIIEGAAAASSTAAANVEGAAASGVWDSFSNVSMGVYRLESSVLTYYL